MRLHCRPGCCNLSEMKFLQSWNVIVFSFFFLLFTRLVFQELKY